MKTIVIFGGAGFIGQHFAKFLIDQDMVEKIILVDIIPLEQRVNLSKYFDSGQIRLIAADVRSQITIDISESVNLICNFAAIHREPGHELAEYYETNIPGAQNVCEWAEKVACKNIIFTSSIAPYGPTELPKTEQAIPTPVSGYGGSKLVAEKLHELWQARDKEHRLVIVRPGVVFGAGEKGNVSRLIKAVLGRYFFYMGNKETRKAGVYVKELCYAMYWMLGRNGNSVTLFNMSMNPGPTMEEYVDVICKTAEVKRWVPTVPFWLLYWISFIIDPITRVLNINQPISPVRLRKLVKSNNIIAEKLSLIDYEYQYTFAEAMADWKSEAPDEWR